MEYKFSLNSKLGKGDCPSCKRKKCFVYYFDNQTNERLSDDVGRCDHENSCGYHKTPKQFFDEQPNGVTCSKLMSKQTRKEFFKTKEESQTAFQYRQEEFLNRQAFLQSNVQELFLRELSKYQSVSSLQTAITSLLLKKNALNPFFTPEAKRLLLNRIERVFEKYGVVGGKKMETVFVQKDAENKIHTAKIMYYDSEAHRKPFATWLHCSMDFVEGVNACKLASKEIRIVQCLFGLCLAKDFTKYKQVHLVESEKTALVMAIVEPEYLWLATGGSSMLKTETIKPLADLGIRKLFLYPDKDYFAKWKKKAEEIEKALNINIITMDILEQQPSLPSNSDLADLVL